MIERVDFFVTRLGGLGLELAGNQENVRRRRGLQLRVLWELAGSPGGLLVHPYRMSYSLFSDLILL